MDQSDGRMIVTADAEVGVLGSPREREQEREVQVVLVEATVWALKLEKFTRSGTYQKANRNMALQGTPKATPRFINRPKKSWC